MIDLLAGSHVYQFELEPGYIFTSFLYYHPENKFLLEVPFAEFFISDGDFYDQWVQDLAYGDRPKLSQVVFSALLSFNYLPPKGHRTYVNSKSVHIKYSKSKYCNLRLLFLDAVLDIYVKHKDTKLRWFTCACSELITINFLGKHNLTWDGLCIDTTNVTNTSPNVLSSCFPINTFR